MALAHYGAAHYGAVVSRKEYPKTKHYTTRIRIRSYRRRSTIGVYIEYIVWKASSFEKAGSILRTITSATRVADFAVSHRFLCHMASV
ncbi:hypothetical protein CEXT_132691 [Caerostris extrusa]|uniref:Uncharacterized protein n=1 Tax=Caerostris extrusa TaxID=172846 RepID=A0AAV4TS16_CAEEX|nr:hypothetical protein CEXT_132691 [Caerostris extrusa]